MLDQSDTMSENEKCQTLPPWIWVCLILYIYELPNLIVKLKTNFMDFLFPTDPTFVDMALVRRFELINSPYWIPRIFLFLGTLSLLFPLIRKYYIEKKYNLTENYQRIPAIIEIENFLTFHAPDLKIKANLLSANEVVFIYPIGYRKTGIAIFGRFIKLWRSDRENAQAVLLHEIGHYRNGDALILGTGSSFEFVLRHTFSIIFFVFLLQIALAFIDLTGTSYRKTFVPQYLLMNIIYYPLPILFQNLAYYVLPIIGIWCAELNADRFMIKSKGDLGVTSLKAIEKLKRETTVKQWLLSQITHPPIIIRRWMATYSFNNKSLLLFLFLFPMAHVFQLFLALMNFLFGTLLVPYLLGALSIQKISETLYKVLIYYVGSRSLIWLSFSILFILWPFIAIYWVRLFSGLREVYNLENYEMYLLNALILTCAFVLSYNLE